MRTVPDTLYGGNLANGGQGNDSIIGVETLNDTLRGGQGDDVIERAGDRTGSRPGGFGAGARP